MPCLHLHTKILSKTIDKNQFSYPGKHCHCVLDSPNAMKLAVIQLKLMIIYKKAI